MSSDPDHGLASTKPAEPSPVDPTRTSPSAIAEKGDPAPRSQAERPPAAPKVRDPGRYEILGEHGRGGLGRVSRAHDVELGRDIAIKELISRGHVSELRFLREALITARLEHPGIVPVHEAGRWPDGTPFYAMKLVAGRSLRALIAEHRTIDERIGLLHHVITVADAIAYAHGRNIIHRDLKPSNVIVGDFGETVVIDWGLAKDLSAEEDLPVGGGPFREAHDDGLTSAGSVLGTPAYMAPEQARGEHVDQRADVHAIGAMLWELCSLEPLPPSDTGQRPRALRRSGIDQDLSAIIEKALDPDPARRYPHAGALAADLKAFKAGTRIAARRYSLFAVLAHWARRHRGLAISASIVAAFAVVGIALYVRNIAAERDRADTSEDSAKRALEELTLKHAQLLLATDPSAAIDALATYRGVDGDAVRQIRAEALGRGVAVVRAVPHTNNACWAEAAPDGDIVSLSTDGTVARTSRTGTSTVVARGVAQLCQYAYSAPRHLLAFVCDPFDICIYDTARHMLVGVAPELQGANAAALAFSPNGTLLAWMTRGSMVTVVDVADPARPSRRLCCTATSGGTDVKFLDDSTVVAHVLGGIELIRLDEASKPELLSVGNSYWDADDEARELVTIDDHGHASIIEASPARVTARGELCPGPAAGLRFLPGRHQVAYACKNGTVGVWAPRDATVTPRLQLEGHADVLAVSRSAEYLIAGGGNAAVTVLDLTTNLAATYKGHKFRLLSIAPPTRESPFVISADASGAIRMWPLPARLAWVVGTTSLPLHTAVFYDGDTKLAATTFGPELTTLSATGIGTAGPHDIYNVVLQRSEDGSALAAYGFNEHIELWSLPAMTRTSTIATNQGTVSQLRFAAGGRDVIAAGHDGRLVRWTPSGDAVMLAQVAQPIVAFAEARATGSIVFADADGALWRTDASRRSSRLQGIHSRILHLIALPDQRTVYVGYASGELVEIDTRSWLQRPLLRAEGSILKLATSADGREVAVATHDAVHVGTRADDRSTAMLSWRRLALRANQLAIAPDHTIVALGTDGLIWLYAIRHRAWLAIPVGMANLRYAVVASSGRVAVVLDAEGRLIQLDLEAARKQTELESTYHLNKDATRTSQIATTSVASSRFARRRSRSSRCRASATITGATRRTRRRRPCAA